MERQILLIELHEFPWRLVDRYRDDPRFPHLRKFFDDSQCFTPLNHQEIASRWALWPSFHRGTSLHRVRFLGQDSRSFHGKTIWQEFRDQGHSIGVFGSPYSWPPVDPGRRGFYVPDPYSSTGRCIPESLEPYQRLFQRVAQRQEFLKPILTCLIEPFEPSIPLELKRKILFQFIQEAMDRRKRGDRATLLAELNWKIFERLYQTSRPPEYACFHTEFLSQIGRKYWDCVFPNDFDSNEKTSDPWHLRTIERGIHLLDQILRKGISFQKKNPNLIFGVVSASGLESNPKQKQMFSLQVKEPKMLIDIFGLAARNFEILLSVSPQIILRFQNRKERTDLFQRMNACQGANGTKLFHLKEDEDMLSVELNSPTQDEIEKGYFISPGRLVRWEQAGIEVCLNPQGGLTRSSPKGVFALRHSSLESNSLRQELSLTALKNFILETSHPQSKLFVDRKKFQFEANRSK